MRFVIDRQTDRQYYFRIVAGGNNATLAHSEGYEDKDNCVHAIRLIQQGAGSAEVIDLT